MSHTVSPGRTRAAHWTGVAVKVSEFLKFSLLGVPFKEPTKAALFSLGRLFEGAQAGIIFNGSRQLPEGMPPMTAITSLVLVKRVFDGCGWPACTDSVRAKMSEFVGLLERLDKEPLQPQDHERARELGRFTEVLAGQGEEDNLDQFLEDDNDDD